MSKNCIECSKPNPEGWFYCRSCGKRSSEPMYSTQFILRDSPWATAIRKDQVGFSRVSMEDSVKSMQKEFDTGNTKKWNERVKKALKQRV
tara:strand:+ start:138 stop:407 length:270 start_codon:yes stop_codon:yes gene_type:complete